MVRVAYHYLNEENWEKLNDKSNANRVLKPLRRLVKLGGPYDRQEIPVLPDWAHNAYLFAFPDQEAPEPWKNDEHWKDEWDSLTQLIGGTIVGVRFDLVPTDEAYVVERAHFADWKYRHNGDKKDATQKYALSRVPADQYDGSFRMPELLIRNPVSLDRLVVFTKIKREIVSQNGEHSIAYHKLAV